MSPEEQLRDATLCVTGPRVLEKAFEYWKNIDSDTGKQIEEMVRAAGSGV